MKARDAAGYEDTSPSVPRPLGERSNPAGRSGRGAGAVSRWMSDCSPRWTSAISMPEPGRGAGGGGPPSGMLDKLERALGEDQASRFHSHFSASRFTPSGGEKMHLTL